MLFDTQQFRGSGVQDVKVWNPLETLGIFNLDPGFNRITCIGHAPTQGRRCRLPINKDNRESILSTIDEISYLRPDDPRIMSRLQLIAGSTLCVRYHQNQAQSILRTWQASINRLNSQTKERTYTSPSQSTKNRSSGSNRTLSDLQAQIQEMKEVIASLQDQTNRENIQNCRYAQQDDSNTQNHKDEERGRRAQEKRDKEFRRHEEDRRKSEEEEEERLKKRMKEERRQREEEKEQQEQRRKEMEDKERQRKEQYARDRAAREQADSERMRLNAQKVRDERKREADTKRRQEREEWDKTWTSYQERWANFRTSTCREGDIRDAIPWPVKSGRHIDVRTSNVKEFMKLATPRDADMIRLMRKECQKWHPDKTKSWLRGGKLTVEDQKMVDMICRVVTGLLSSSAGKSSEFL